MESFTLMDNSVINKINESSVVPKRPDNIENTLKTVVKVNNYNSPGFSIYGSKHRFNIPKEFDNLSQLYIKCYIKTAFNSAVDNQFAAKIFKRMKLKTKNEVELQTITDVYTIKRLDGLQNTTLITKINQGLQPNTVGFPSTFTFLAFTEATCVVPLFFFFSELINEELNTRNYEQLELECIVNDDKESMGMEFNIASFRAELICNYHDVNTSSSISDMIIYKQFPRPLYGCYNIFEEDIVTVSSGSTSIKVLLRCPFPTFAIHLTLKRPDSKQTLVRTFKLQIRNNTVVETDYRLNYEMNSENDSYLESGGFSHFFNKDHKRCYDSGLVTFSKEMYPAYATIGFEALDGDHVLTILNEYRSVHKIDDYGRIYPNSSDKPGSLQQMNADKAV